MYDEQEPKHRKKTTLIVLKERPEETNRSQSSLGLGCQGAQGANINEKRKTFRLLMEELGSETEKMPPSPAANPPHMSHRAAARLWRLFRIDF